MEAAGGDPRMRVSWWAMWTMVAGETLAGGIFVFEVESTAALVYTQCLHSTCFENRRTHQLTHLANSLSSEPTPFDHHLPSRAHLGPRLTYVIADGDSAHSAQNVKFLVVRLNYFSSRQSAGIMASLISSIKAHAHPPESHHEPNPLASLPTPPTLPPPLRLLVALATIAATTDNPLYPALPKGDTDAWRAAGTEWAVAVRRMLQIEETSLPASVSRAQVSSAAEGHWADMNETERKEEQEKVVRLLVIASIFQPPIKGEQVATVTVPESSTATTAEKIHLPKEETVPTLSYTPPARQFIYTTLTALHIPPTPSLPLTEKSLAASLYTTLQQVRAADVDAAREKQAEGWGGSTGRWIATGVGAVVGGVAIGLTGGLAAPAIAALVPSFMTFGLLTSATAPVVIGSVFGLAGGGLTSKRVRERWRGVAEFEFVDVKLGSVARRGSIEKSAGEKVDEPTAPSLIVSPLSLLSLPFSTSSYVSQATIVVPGLLTKSRTEAIDAWRDRIVPSSPLQDGRDVFVLNYETEHMLQTGKAIDSWVTSKLKGYVKKEVIKRTVLSAYFMAVSLPMWV